MIAEQLRAAILQAAISGKLTDQRPEDGTAAELLESISEEKAALVKAGKLKKPKPLPPVAVDEQPFEIPDNWEWARLGDGISLVSGRDLPSQSYFEGTKGIPYITGASNFFKGKIRTSRRTLSPSAIANKGDLLVTVKGTIGELAFLQESQAHIARQVMAVSTPWLHLPYIEVILAFSINRLKANARSMIPGIDRAALLKLTVPLPPLAEQERIVAKLDKLTPLIDQLAELEREREDLDRAFFTALEAAILQAATRGHLTLQYPEDGTATELLTRIAAEKTALVKAGKLKKPKPLPPVAVDEQPFDIPDNWAWTRLGEVGNWRSGATPNRSDTRYFGGATPWVKSGEVEQDWITETDEYLTAEALAEYSLPLIPPDSVLVAMYGANAGEVGLLGVEAVTNQAIVAGTLFVDMSSRYVRRYVQGSRRRLESLTSGAAQPNLSGIKVKNSPLPLPPVAEQVRIAEKLDAVLPLVRELQEASA